MPVWSRTRLWLIKLLIHIAAVEWVTNERWSGISHMRIETFSDLDSNSTRKNEINGEQTYFCKTHKVVFVSPRHSVWVLRYGNKATVYVFSLMISFITSTSWQLHEKIQEHQSRFEQLVSLTYFVMRILDIVKMWVLGIEEKETLDAGTQTFTIRVRVRVRVNTKLSGTYQNCNVSNPSQAQCPIKSPWK